MAETTTGMLGRGFYDRHSEFQRRVAERAGAALAELARRVALPPDGDGGRPFGVADYGCAEGRNSIATVGRVLDAVAKRCPAGSAFEPFVVHNDLPTNDFATLLANLAAPGSYLAGRPDVRVLTAPRSFFERVVPLGTIRFGTSDSAAALAVPPAAGPRPAARALPLRTRRRPSSRRSWPRRRPTGGPSWPRGPRSSPPAACCWCRCWART